MGLIRNYLLEPGIPLHWKCLYFVLAVDPIDSSSHLQKQISFINQSQAYVLFIWQSCLNWCIDYNFNCPWQLESNYFSCHWQCWTLFWNIKWKKSDTQCSISETFVNVSIVCHWPREALRWKRWRFITQHRSSTTKIRTSACMFECLRLPVKLLVY